MPAGPYVFLPGRAHLVSKRKTREAWSRKKWPMARRAALLLRHVPGILCVGVTGALAVGNAGKDDDIDLLCLTRRGWLWTGRLFATLLLDMLGIRRRPGDTNVSDKMCLNMFLAEDSFALPRGERDLFSAHEVLQMVPLWERDGAYGKFLRANSWVKEFLPNAWEQKYPVPSIQYQEKQNTAFSLLESAATWLQLRHMERRRTNEVITEGALRFHPKDARVWVRDAFARRARRLEIPLDKFFPRR
jgi:hypothetical protein